MARELSVWLDRRALDNCGELLGTVVDIYDDARTRRPSWLAISTGFFGTRIAVAPVRGASLLGDDVVVAHDRHTVTHAPTVDIVVTVEPNQHQRLLDHYARPDPVAPDHPEIPRERGT